VSIIATTLLAAILISTGDLGELADMTVFLLLGVFIMVNIAVLVLRRDAVSHRHFHAPTVIPVIGAIVSLALMVFETEGKIAVRALFLLGVGAILFAVTWLSGGARRDPLDTQQMEAIARPGDRDDRS
jgi:APA family basic amino acid/polyamine antiporter